MKEKILAALKTKYANLGFTDKAFEGVATFLVASTTEENQIETAVSGVETLLKSFQGDADSRVNKLKAENEELKKKLPEEKKEEEKKPIEGETATEKLLRTLTEQNAALLGRIDKIESGATEATMTQRLEAALNSKLGEKPNELALKFKAETLENFKYMKFDDPAKFEEFLTAKTTSAETIVKSINESNLGALPKPSITDHVGADGKPVSGFKAMMQGVTENKLAEKAEATK